MAGGAGGGGLASVPAPNARPRHKGQFVPRPVSGPRIPPPSCPLTPGSRPRGERPPLRCRCRHAAPRARGPLNCSQNGWHLDQLICKTGVNHLIRGPHAGREPRHLLCSEVAPPPRVYLGKWKSGGTQRRPAAGLRPPATCCRPPDPMPGCADRAGGRLRCVPGAGGWERGPRTAPPWTSIPSR